MKKPFYLFAFVCIVLLALSCSKANVSNHQQENTSGDSEPSGQTSSDSAFVQIINQSERGDALVDTVYFSGGGVLGGEFPVKSGDTAGVYTTAAGNQVLYIKVSGGTSKSLSIIGSDGGVKIFTRSEPGTRTYGFPEVSVSSADTVHITYNTDKP